MSHNQNSSPVESCAKEIYTELTDFFGGDDALKHCLTESEIAEIIQRCVSSEVAKVHGEYQKLAEEWEQLAVAIKGADEKAEKDTAAFGWKYAASYIRALAPNKEGQK